MPVAKFSFLLPNSKLINMKMSSSDRELPPQAPTAAGEYAPMKQGLNGNSPSSKKAKKHMKRANKLRLGGNSAEIRSYLSKLQDLVPFVPKDRKCSKLEVIQGVIDYICHLQGALQTHPAVVGASGSTTVVVSECKVPYCQQQAALRAVGMDVENEEPESSEQGSTCDEGYSECRETLDLERPSSAAMVDDDA